MKRRLLKIGCVLCFMGFMSSLCAEEVDSSLPVMDSLDYSSKYSKIILTLPKEELLSREQRFIALDPLTERITITSTDISMTEEAESFAHHRRHYIAFWSVFSIMFGMDILWSE